MPTPLLSFLAGLVVMAAEMAASRLIAPYFGTSTPVWSILIAFVPVGMAVGAELGGRAADRWSRGAGPGGGDPRLRRLSIGLAAAALALAALPFSARLLLRPAADGLLAGRPAAAIALAGLFAASALPPVVLLGAVGPVLARVELGASPLAPGARVGRLSAAATLGSIGGTLLASFVLLPLLGTARTLGALAGLLALSALAGLPRRWWLPTLAGPFAALAAAPLALPLLPGAIDFAESAATFAQVIERPSGRRDLVFDEAYAVQSVAGDDGTDEVFGHYLLAPSMSATPGPAPSVLLLGLGGGTSARGLRRLYPGATIVGVELDGAVVELARRRLDLPTDLEVHVGDARAFLARDRRRYDAIVVDAVRFPYVPFHLTTHEFAIELANHLTPGGVVVFNAGRYGPEKDVVHAIGRTLAGVLPEVLAVDAKNHSNTLLYAGPPGLIARLRARADALPVGLRRLAARVAREPSAVLPGPPLTDDHAPVELLTDAILARALLETGGRL